MGSFPSSSHQAIRVNKLYRKLGEREGNYRRDKKNIKTEYWSPEGEAVHGAPDRVPLFSLSPTQCAPPPSAQATVPQP